MVHVGVIGINHKSAPLATRELLARACCQCFAPDSLYAVKWGTVLLSTCNRTEIYFSAPDLTNAHCEILNILRSWVQINFEHNLYAYFNQNCFLHLANVAAGLDSAIIAETEIQGQVKQAYTEATKRYKLHCFLHFLFQKSLNISKSVRARYPLPRGLITLEQVLWEIVHNFCLRQNTPALFIGNSQVNRKIISYFRSQGLSHITLCTRNLASAHPFAQEHGIHTTDSASLRTWSDWPIVIAGSNQQTYVVNILPAMHRDYKQQHLLIDLSVPRNIDPCLLHYPNMTLLNMEEIAKIMGASRMRCLSDMDSSKDWIKTAVEYQWHVFQQRTTCKNTICA